MKNGKRPTRAQKEFIKSKGLNPENYLVVKDTPEVMHIVHRLSDKTTRIIPKGGEGL